MNVGALLNSITVAEFIGAIVAIAAIIVGLSKAWEVIPKPFKKLAKKDTHQDEIIKVHSNRLDDHDKRFVSLEGSIELTKETNRMILKGIGILIRDNQAEDVKKYDKELNTFLISKLNG